MLVVACWCCVMVGLTACGVVVVLCYGGGGGVLVVMCVSRGLVAWW